uniref:Acetylcholine receptor subunit beta-like protein n=1 Tax=Ascaris suum TaxID=6253 RepID=F1L107_ASCSU
MAYTYSGEGSPSGKDSLSNSFLCRPSTSKCEKAIPTMKKYSQSYSKAFERRTNPYRHHSGKQDSEPKVTSNFDRFGHGADQGRRARRRIHDVIFLNLLQQVRFIAEHFQRREDEAEISDDWTFVAMVLDRLFLIIFSVLNVGTFLIILEAPSLYDTREPMNITVASKPLGQANVLGGHSHF